MVNSRFNFIVKVLNIFLQYFNMELITIGDDVENLRLRYNFNKDLIIEATVTFKEVLEFFDMYGVYYLYTTITPKKLFDYIIKSKYFNINIFEKYRKELQYDIDDPKTRRMIIDFIFYIDDDVDKKDMTHYIFTKYTIVHLKAVDFFFKTDFEESIIDLQLERKEKLLSLDNVKSLIRAEFENANDEDIKSIIDITGYMSEDQGGIDSYLALNNDEEIRSDLLETYRWYTAQT